MNKEERVLVQKLRTSFKTGVTSTPTFSPEESLIIEHWLALGYLQKHAFEDTTSFGAQQKQFLQLPGNYPFSGAGEDFVTKCWYFRFRESKPIAVIRDVISFLAFAATLWLTIIEPLITSFRSGATP